MEFNKLDSLSPGQKTRNLLVRVTKKSPLKEIFPGLPQSKPNKLQLFNITCIDITGEVCAVVYKWNSTAFYESVDENEVYVIENPKIKAAGAYSRSKNVEIVINDGTKMTLAEEMFDSNPDLAEMVEGMPQNFYPKPVCIKDLVNLPTNEIVDLFAMIKDVQPICIMNDSKQNQLQMKVVELKDGPDTCNLTLWRDMVAAVTPTTYPPGTLIAAKGVRISYFNGVQVEGLCKFTEIIRNPNHQMVNEIVPVKQGGSKSKSVKTKTVGSPSAKRMKVEKSGNEDDEIETVTVD